MVAAGGSIPLLGTYRRKIMAKRKPVLRNNKIVKGKEYDFLTLAAEKIVMDSIESMFKKLAKLQNVETYEDEEDRLTASPLNSDTYFREQLYEAIEQEVSGQFRNY